MVYSAKVWSCMLQQHFIVAKVATRFPANVASLIFVEKGMNENNYLI